MMYNSTDSKTNGLAYRILLWQEGVSWDGVEKTLPYNHRSLLNSCQYPVCDLYLQQAYLN